MLSSLRELWLRSTWYRRLLSLALAFLLLRLGGQVYYLFIVQPLEMGSFHGVFVPNDLKDYLEAAERFSLRQDLYLEGRLNRVEFYQYAPSYALALTPLLHLHPTIILIGDVLLHLAAYIALYLTWQRIFRRLNLPRGEEMLTWTLPLWLVFEPFWSDLSYLNIYILVALLASWLTEAVLREDLTWSAILSVVLLQVKPFWAFALGVPFLLGPRKFFWKTLGLTLAGYLAVMGITIVAAGPQYGLQQYAAYFRFLVGMSANFPWRGPELSMLGYNHSVMQTVLYLAGISPQTRLLANGLKFLILLPLAGLGAWHLFHPAQKETDNLHKLEMAFTLYLAAFLFLDIIWEVTLGLAVFAYLLAITHNRLERWLACLVFIPYCLLDAWRFVSYLLWGERCLAGAYILTDPSAYLPMILFVLLIFYALLLRRLFERAAAFSHRNSKQAAG